MLKALELAGFKSFADRTRVDFPDGITSGLRRTTDMVRGVVERTRGDLTVAYRQNQLENSLRRLEETLQDQSI